MMTMTNKCVLLPVLCLLPLLIRCAVAPLAGGSDNPDFLVVGTVVDTSGQPARNAVVTIVPALYNPVTDPAPAASMIDTTSANGAYRLAVTQKGGYSVQAVHLQQRTRLLITGITVAHDTTPVAAAALGVTGVVKVSLPTTGVNPVTGYVYIPGTTLCAFLNNRVDTVVLDSIPAGTLPMLSYAAINTTGSLALRYDIPVASGDTTVVLNPSWKYCRRIVLNTTATGANIAGNVAEFPVLVRLDGGKFDFSQARPDGADIRFTKGEGAPLPYEIEQWDPVAGFAEVWVKVDTVYGNNDGQYIVMYWGASAGSATSSMSNGAAVFDTGNGFQGVWHMGEAGNAIAKDATANHFDGTPSDTAPEGAAGVIGSCRSFNGTSNFIRMNGTADSRLNFQENGTYTVSAWVYADTIDNRSHLVVGKSNEQYFMKFKFSIPTDPMVWEFVEYHGKTGWSITNSLPVAPSAKTWTHIVGVREGTSQFFYLNGELVDSSISVSPATAPRQTGEDVTIGRFLSVAPDSLEGKCPFLGKIDEVRISNAAYGADWIKLCYMNQKELDALVKW
jgi:hypothetical protein